MHIDSVTLRIEGTSVSTFSNKAGHFSIAVPDSSWNSAITISARALGYATSRVSVIVSDSALQRDIELDPCQLRIWDPSDPPDVVPRAPIGDIARAANLDDLRTKTHATPEREIRIWLWGKEGNPFDLFRFVDSAGVRSGEHVSSTLNTYRCRHDVPGKVGCGLPSPSGTIPSIGDVYMCRRIDDGREDWSKWWLIAESDVAKRLLRMGRRYSAKDERHNPHFMTIESWDGARYHSGSYALQIGADTVARTDAERLAASLTQIP